MENYLILDLCNIIYQYTSQYDIVMEELNRAIECHHIGMRGTIGYPKELLRMIPHMDPLWREKFIKYWDDRNREKTFKGMLFKMIRAIRLKIIIQYRTL